MQLQCKSSVSGAVVCAPAMRIATALVLALALGAPAGVLSEKRDANSSHGAVRVHDRPLFVAEHAQLQLPGKYIKTLFLELTQAQRIVAVPVHDGEVADTIAADFFRQYDLAFDDQYIPVHNSIAAIQQGLEGLDGIADISQSQVDPLVAAAAKTHPVLAALDQHSQVLTDVTVHITRGGAVFTLSLRVLEGDLPETAVQRWEAAVAGEEGGWGRYGGVLTHQERSNVLEEVEEQMLLVLVREDDIAARMRGWAAGGGANKTPPFKWESLRGTLLTAPLPPPTAVNSARREGTDEEVADAVAAQEMIYKMQYPAECRGRRAVVNSFDGAVWGLAVNVHYMSLLLNYCILTNRTLVSAQPDYWNYAGKRCSDGWECYMEPLSKCSEGHVWQPYTSDIRDDIRLDYRKYLYKVDTSSEQTLYFRNVDGPWLQKLLSPEYQLYVPERFRHRGLLWWRSQLTRYLFRPKPFVKEYIAHRRAAMGWPAGSGRGGLVGLHVRHGDKSWDVMHQGSFIGPLAPYIAKAQRLCAEGAAGAGPGLSMGGCGSTSRYFLSTDDTSVLQEAEKMGLDAIWDAEEARYNGTHVYATLGVSDKKWPGFPGNDANVDTVLYALDSIKSIMLLADTARFIGTATSCFSRLVLQLRVASGLDTVQLGTSDAWTVDSDPRYPASPGWFVDP